MALIKSLLLLLLVSIISAAAQPKLDDPTGYFAPNSLHQNYTQQVSFSQYVAYSQHSLALVAGYDNDLHRYDNKQQLVDSFARNQSQLIDGLEPKRSPLPASEYLQKVRYDSSEFQLLHNQSDITLVANELNQVECAQQLDQMLELTQQLVENYHTYANSRRLDLIDWLDSWGSAPTDQLLMGNNQWLGSYEQCQLASLQLNGQAQLEGRYCLAGLRLPSPSNSSDNISGSSVQIKLGICLPRACNSISVLRHSERLEALIRLVRLQQVPYSSAHLISLYCLPDEDSPLRQFSWSARLFLGAITSWLVLILCVSLKLEWAYTRRQLMNQRQPASGEHSKLIQIFAFRHAWQQLFGTAKSGGPKSQLPAAAPAPSISHSINLSGAKTIVVVTGSDAITGEQVEKTGSDGKVHAISGGQVDKVTGSDKPQQKRDNQLAAIDGLKVISMVWLISAHTMLFFIRNITNGRDFWSLVLDARFMTIMAGIFPVDSFFTITGVLTAYLKFNQVTAKGELATKTKSFTKLNYWLEMFVHRYLRFMPMYLLIFWFTRDVSEYLGSGPMWDYATASSSLRSMCKRESVLVPMLFQANFKPIDQHCVKPAWYLANDYQYLLITPFFMLLLLASRWLGYLAIVTGVIGSLIMQFLTVYYPQNESTGSLAATTSGMFTDFEGLVNFRPMFAAYVLKDLWRLYVLPYNRILPYLIGLLTGHLMFLFNGQRNCSTAHATVVATSEQSTESLAAHLSSSSSSSSSSGISSESDSETPPPTPPIKPLHKQHLRKSIVVPVAERSLESTSSPSISQVRILSALLSCHINLNIWAPVGVLLAVIYLPLASKILEPQVGENARIGASLIIALMRLTWSISIARLIYVCFVTTTTTAQLHKQPNGSFIIDFLSSPKWKPWSKIGLSVLLIQWEIIGYVAQIQTTPPFMTISFLIAAVLVCIISSYVLGLLVYLIFEFPLSQIELLFIRPKLFPNNNNNNNNNNNHKRTIK